MAKVKCVLVSLAVLFYCCEASNVTQCYYCSDDTSCNDPMDKDVVRKVDCNTGQLTSYFTSEFDPRIEFFPSFEYGCMKIVVKKHYGSNETVTTRSCYIKGMPLMLSKLVDVNTCHDDLCNGGNHTNIPHLFWIIPCLVLLKYLHH